MKNEMEIKTDVFLLLKESALAKAVGGKLSKTRRPAESEAEDIVISVLTPSANSQVQEVYLNVNVYVPDIRRGNGHEEDSLRLNELCRLSYEALGTHCGSGYRLSLTEQKVMRVEGVDEHFINNRVLYQVCNY